MDQRCHYDGLLVEIEYMQIGGSFWVCILRFGEMLFCENF